MALDLIERLHGLSKAVYHWYGRICQHLAKAEGPQIEAEVALEAVKALLEV